MTEIAVPDIGDYTDVPVIEVHVAPGDVVAEEDPLVTLESDKATMDVPATASGKVQDVRVKVGDTVSEGSVVVVVSGDGAGPLTTPPSLVGQQEPPPEATPAGPAPSPPTTTMTVPSLTVSPTFTRTSCTGPDAVAGTSMVALSDSRVTSGSSSATTSPGATCTSITGTSV